MSARTASAKHGRYSSNNSCHVGSRRTGRRRRSHPSTSLSLRSPKFFALLDEAQEYGIELTTADGGLDAVLLGFGEKRKELGTAETPP